MSDKQFFSLAEVAERWGCSHSSVLSLVYEGLLPAVDISTNPRNRSRYIIKTEDLQTFEAARTVEKTPSPPLRRRRVKVRQNEVIEFIR